MTWEEPNSSSNSDAPLGAQNKEEQPANSDTSPAPETGANESGAHVRRTTHQGDEQADGLKPDHNSDSDERWPPPGAAILPTDDARLYLYEVHDSYIKERYFQKLVSDQHKMDGRRLPKDGGGSELQIVVASIDKFIAKNPSKKNAASTPLDAKDKLFDRLRQIAAEKPYGLMIEGVAHVTNKPPIETPAPAQSDHREAATEQYVEKQTSAM
ncbi:MAG: hypothetical protein K0U74_11935 [Alphaproteobacteria bacterium]|nr:hypothetical protein [Alphaproteobacteria bacterium]